MAKDHHTKNYGIGLKGINRYFITLIHLLVFCDIIFIFAKIFTYDYD